MAAPLRLGLGAAMIGAALTLAGRWLLPGRSGRRRSGRRAPGVRSRPLEAVAADLRRLDRRTALVPSGMTVVRWRALWAAYDDVLAEAADLLEVPHELATTPLGLARDIERLRVVAALENAGLAVRG